jgi:branched-chain amino acid transport system ATP-binding protein
MLRIENLNAGYGKFQILFDVNLKIEPKKITTIVGPNGSGKSTLLKTIFGLTTVFSGRIIYEDKDITKTKPHIRAKMGIAYLPQTDNVFTSLTVKENLKLASYSLNKEEREKKIEEVVEMFPVVKKKLSQKAITLSGGERQMVAIAMSLIRSPKLMLFDEPTGNLAPIIAKQILETITFLSRELGITVIIVEQNARRALEISDYSYLLVSGRVNFEGNPKDLLGHKELAKLYLGLT